MLRSVLRRKKFLLVYTVKLIPVTCIKLFVVFGFEQEAILAGMILLCHLVWCDVKRCPFRWITEQARSLLVSHAYKCFPIFGLEQGLLLLLLLCAALLPSVSSPWVPFSSERVYNIRWYTTCTKVNWRRVG